MSFYQNVAEDFQAATKKALDNRSTTNRIGIAGFTGFARTNESIKLTSTVPSEVVEDGTILSDDIINNATVVTIDGVVADMIIEDAQYPEIVPKDVSELGEISALLPAKSQQQYQRLTQINSQLRDGILLAQRAERIGQKAYDFASGNTSGGSISIQEQFIERMQIIHEAKNPIEISVSYRKYPNMAMQDLTINRNNTDGSTTFSASFVEQRFASLLYSEVSASSIAPSVSGSAAKKTSNAVNAGGQNPESNTEVELTSALSSIFS